MEAYAYLVTYTLDGLNVKQERSRHAYFDESAAKMGARSRAKGLGRYNDATIIRVEVFKLVPDKLVWIKES